MTSPSNGWETRQGRIKRELPIAWAVGSLLGLWVSHTDPVRCPFPEHEDSTPSFNLWAIDPDTRQPQRASCFGCGRGGDVIDIIRLARGVGFGAACDLADTELIPAFRASGWKPLPPQELDAPTPDLEAVLARMLQDTGLKQFLAVKAERAQRLGFSTPEFHGYVKRVWGWGCTPGAVIFPHRGPSNRLTGVKLRAANDISRRWAWPGSRFPYLYGAWRPQSSSKLLLCEGETDTAWAAFCLQGTEWQALGLPSGAAQKPTSMQLDMLNGREVCLAFDGDDAGREATRKWQDALAGTASELQIPEGEDLLSCGLDVRDLVGA